MSWGKGESIGKVCGNIKNKVLGSDSTKYY